MRPASFSYVAPVSLDEAVETVAENADDVTVMAGGQSLIPAMTLRLARPELVVDIGRLPGLDGIEVSGEAIVIGTLATHAAIERSADLFKALPVLPRMAGHIAHPAIRNRGTFGGSLAHADPASEWPCAALTMGATMAAVSRRGERIVPAATFFRSFLTTDLAEDEILVSVTLPHFGPRWRWAFHEVARQAGAYGMAFALVGAEIDDDGTLRGMRLGVGACGDTPLVPIDDWTGLIGTRPSERDVEAIVRQAVAALEPMTDANASAEDRRVMAESMIRRGLCDVFGLKGKTGGGA